MNRVFAFVLLVVASAADVCSAQLGDWDNDGRVEYSDAIGLVNCVTGTGQSTQQCASVFDFDFDGQVSLQDVMAFANTAMPPDCQFYAGQQRGKGFFGYVLSYEPVLGFGEIYAVDVAIPHLFQFVPSLCNEDVVGDTSPAQSTLMCDIRYESPDSMWPDGAGATRYELWWVQGGVTRGRNWALNHLLHHAADEEAVHPYFESYDAYRTLRLDGPYNAYEVPSDRELFVTVRRLTQTNTTFQVIFAWLDNFGTPRSFVTDYTIPSAGMFESANKIVVTSECNFTEDHATIPGQAQRFVSCLWAPGSPGAFQELDFSAAIKLDPKPNWVVVSDPYASPGASVSDSFIVHDIR